MLLLHPKHARPKRSAEPFVQTRTEEVAFQIRYLEDQMGEAMRTVYHHQDSPFLCLFGDGRYRKHLSRPVHHMLDQDYLGLGQN